MTTATYRHGSQLEISLQSPKDAVLSDAEESVHSCDATDTVSIPDQETLDKDIAELVRDKQDRQTASNKQYVNDSDDILAQISQDLEGSKDHGDNIISQLGDIVNKIWSTTCPEERRKEKLNKYAIPKKMPELGSATVASQLYAVMRMSRM